MDKPEMDLLSLPDNFKLQILKKLDWKSLKNLKLVCRDFYFIIEKNIQFLDRPKVEHLEISYDKYRPLRVRYDLKDSGNTSFETSKMVEFGNACEYEDFLRNKDFTGIKRLVLNTVTNPELIILSDDSDTRREFSKLNFYTSISNGTSYFEFPQITILSTKKLVIPYNGNLLGMQSLRKLGIFEVNKLSLVLKKIIMDVITGNPMLEYENTSIVDTKRLHVQIANHLFELGLLNPENSCARKQYKLFFRNSVEFTILEKEFYRRLFDKIKFRNNLTVKDNRKRYYIVSSMSCSKCGNEHKNLVYYCYGWNEKLKIEFH